jgi:hypothetical protein
VDPLIRRALCNFYREEFERQIDHLLTSGLLGDETRDSVDPVCRRFLSCLDRVAWRSDFSTVAEALLRNFDALTQLTSQDALKRH